MTKNWRRTFGVCAIIEAVNGITTRRSGRNSELDALQAAVLRV